MKTNYNNSTVNLFVLLFLLFQGTYAQNWQQLPQPSVGGVPMDWLYSITGHTTGVYLSSDQGVYRSTDNGSNFTNLTFGNGVTANLPIYCLFIDDTDGAIYIGGDTTVFKSIDGGSSWSATALNTANRIYDINKANGNMVIVDGNNNGGGAYYSTDGLTTVQNSTGLPNAQMLDLIYYNNKMFIAGSGGMYSSTDNGVTWAAQGTGHPAGGRYVKTEELNGNLFSADLNGKGLFKSSDNGETWANADPNTFIEFCQVFDLTSGSGIILALTDGVQCNPQGVAIRLSDDDGATWQSGLGNLSQAFYNHLGKSADGSCFYVYAPFEAKLYTTCDLTVGISENNLSAISIFPNPTTGILSISGITEAANVALYNIQGKLLKEYSQISNNNSIDISDFSAGLYFLKVQNEGGFKTFKVIRE